VVNAEPPLVAAEVMGSVQDRGLMARAFDDPALLDQPVGSVMDPPLPTVGSGEALEYVVERLEGAAAVLVLDAGHPVGILTRSDVLEFITT
jgi:cystathionine beta-synthase